MKSGPNCALDRVEKVSNLFLNLKEYKVLILMLSAPNRSVRKRILTLALNIEDYSASCSWMFLQVSVMSIAISLMRGTPIDVPYIMMESKAFELNPTVAS